MLGCIIIAQHALRGSLSITQLHEQHNPLTIYVGVYWFIGSVGSLPLVSR